MTQGFEVNPDLIVIPLPGDNLAYVYRSEGNRAFAVDAGQAGPVLQCLGQRGWELEALFVTHHHWDHTGGVKELKRRYGCRLIGSDAQRIDGLDEVARHGDVVHAAGVEVEVVGTPGHTRSSVCYYVRGKQDKQVGVLFSGDTLFVGGCGRILECDVGTMWMSLQRLSRLPEPTLVCAGHDYALENYEFAVGIMGKGGIEEQRLKEIRAAQQQGKRAVVSRISDERRSNIFLRSGQAEVRKALGMEEVGTVEVFAELRRRKDAF